MKTIYPELEALSLPLIQAYHADLQTHDREWIEAHPGTPFLHFTRECGTFIETLYPADDPYWPAEGDTVPFLFGTANREHILKQVVRCCEGNLRRETIRLTLYFNGKRLVEITPTTALEIAQDYTRRVRREWRKAALCTV